MSHSLGISKNFTTHQNKDTPPVQLTVYNLITINNLICLVIYILKHRAQYLWNKHFPELGNFPIICDFPL